MRQAMNALTKEKVHPARFADFSGSVGLASLYGNVLRTETRIERQMIHH
jgi:hypothetical protein